MNIPRFLQLYKENRMEEAFLSVILDNPLPSSTGRVCQHPCDSRCRRQTLDQAVNMREVHRFIADATFSSDKYESMIRQITARRLEPTGRKIAVVGAGPAGLTAAFYLALLGHEVDGLRQQIRSRRDAPLRSARIQASKGDTAARNRTD